MNPSPTPSPGALDGGLSFLDGDRTKFAKIMEMFSQFTSIEEMHKEADIVVMKVTKEELKTMIPDLVKGTMSVDILL